MSETTLRLAFQRAGYRLPRGDVPGASGPNHVAPTQRLGGATTSGRTGATDQRPGWAPRDRSLPRTSIKDNLAGDLAAIRAMADEDLMLEDLSLTANIEIIRSDIAAERAQPERGGRWQAAAERALAHQKVRKTMCVGELAARKAQAVSAQLQQSRAAQAAMDERNRYRLFAKHAHEVLPGETREQIWALVHAELGRP